MMLEERTTLPTGVDTLDRKLGGGIPLGTVTALSANPASQSELFLYKFAATRPTVYLSTVRTGDTIAAALENREIEADTVEVIRIRDQEPIDHAQEFFSELDDGTNLIIDPVDVLEAQDDARYRRFLADLKHRVTGTENVVFLHCLRDEATPDRRRDTVHVADLFFELSTVVSGDSVVNRLSIPKFRNGQSMEEVIKLDLTSEVEVDRSRNIL